MASPNIMRLNKLLNCDLIIVLLQTLFLQIKRKLIIFLSPFYTLIPLCMKCYICNKSLKIKEKITDESKETETHYEHIIQNNLRGRIGSNEILCSKCGNKLNTEIDSDFVRFFLPITEQLKDFLIQKEHGKNNEPNAILGKLLWNEFENLDVVYKDGSISSHKPFYKIDWDKKQALIACNKKILADFEKKVFADIESEGFSLNDFEIKKITDFDEAFFIPYFGKDILHLDEKISLGYIKIAIEYA